MVTVATDIRANPDYGRTKDTDTVPAAVLAVLMPWSWVAMHVIRVCTVQQQHTAQATRRPQLEAQIMENSVSLVVIWPQTSAET